MASRIDLPQLRETSTSIVVLIVTVSAVIALLEVLVRVRILTSSFFPAPSTVLFSIPEVVSSSIVPLEQTLAEIAVAFLLSLAAALSFGLIMGNLTSVYSVANTYVSLLLSTPKIIFLPLLILWLGLGLKTTITFSVLEASLPMILLLSGAVRDFDKQLIRVARSFGTSRLEMQTKIILPALAPTILSAARIGLLFSAVGVLVAQMFLGFGGIGGLLMDYAYDLRIAELYAVALFLSAVIVALLLIMNYAAHRLVARWHTPLSL